MAVNKFQRSRLAFDFSAKVSHIEVPSTDKNIVFSETTRPIELKFYITTPYDRFAKIYTNCSGHMTKMATEPIYTKNPLISSLEPKGQRPWKKVCSIGDVGPTRLL